MAIFLTVLAELEACSFRNKSSEETAAHMKPLLEKYLRLDHNSSGSTQLALQRQKDHYSHFILRLAFASTEDLRRRFARVETMLFRLRLAAEDTKDRNKFVESLNLDWEMVSEDEKRELATQLSSASNYGWKGVAPEDETWCKVDWERVPDLVEGRRVYLKAGMAYVPSKEQSSMVLAEFTSRLERALEVSIEHGPCRQLVYFSKPISHSSPPAHFHDLTKTIASRLSSIISPKTLSLLMLLTRADQANCPPEPRSLRATSTLCLSTSQHACLTCTDHCAETHT